MSSIYIYAKIVLDDFVINRVLVFRLCTPDARRINIPKVFQILQKIKFYSFTSLDDWFDLCLLSRLLMTPLLLTHT